MEKINSEDQSNYRVNEISKIKNYFNEEIRYQQSLTNKLSKHLTININYFNSCFNSIFIHEYLCPC